MKKFILALSLIFLTLFTYGQVNYCDSIEISITSQTATSVTFSSNIPTLNIPAPTTVQQYNWTLTDESGTVINSLAANPLFSLPNPMNSDTNYICLMTIFYNPAMTFTCITCDTVIWNGTSWVLLSMMPPPCNLTGGSVYIDNNTNPSMMNATVNGMSMYNYSWIDTNGLVISTANQTPFYTQWCVTILDNLTGCDTTICQDCTAGTAVCMCTMIYMPVCGCDGVQYANSCLADCADVPWTPAISNGMPGGWLPCTTPSWDCNPGQGCYDPGSGSGAYTSLAACQSNCLITPSWDCNPVQGCFDPGTGQGAYTTYNACDTACSMVNPSWNCINGACIDPLTGQGTYTNYNACATACVTPTWDCINGACIDLGTGQGAYATYNACNANCIALTWDCVNSSCFDPGTGQGIYASYNACAIACVATAINEKISELLIYPNPTKNTLTIAGNYTSATIYNVFGKVVLTTDYQNTIDVVSLSNGVYFMHINTNNAITVKKITIAK